MEDYTEWSQKFRKRLGEGLKAKRSESGYSQGRLAKICGMSMYTLQKWEQGKNRPDLESLLWMCKCTGWKLSDIIGGRQNA